MTSALLVGAAWLGIAASPAAAQGGTGYSVTFVARECSSYSYIFANTSRDNLVQTLEDVGPDSPYSRDPNTGFLVPLVNPQYEDQAPQLPPNCKPLVGWAFTMGYPGNEGIFSGPWGDLTVVHNPLRSVYTTASAPELDQNGVAIGPLIGGAVT
ncbi:MAG: hypothetical protein JO046_00125, partial [Solirubrobacterales bacterium]|nr:hypothetical protein [Solirubrobacterales bacterium]